MLKGGQGKANRGVPLIRKAWTSREMKTARANLWAYRHQTAVQTLGSGRKLNTKVNKVFTLCKSRTAAVLLD